MKVEKEEWIVEEYKGKDITKKLKLSECFVTSLNRVVLNKREIVKITNNEIESCGFFRVLKEVNIY